MAGILDRKSRIIDYSLTENGRSQIQSGDIRFVYASVSDKSILYEKDFEKSMLHSEDVVNIDNYIPFEVDTKTFGSINNEFNLDKAFTITNSNLLNTVRNENSAHSNVTFDEATNIFLEKSCIGSSLKNLNLISQKTILSSSGLSFVDKGTLINNFDFKNRSFIARYPTVKALNARPRDMVSISLDKRFENNNNFMKLIPESTSGNKLYDESQFERDEADYKDVCIESIYKTINEQIDYGNVINRNDLILKAIDIIESNNDVQKREYIIKQSSESDSFIFNIYESDEDLDTLEKLAIIDLGRLFNNISGKSKKVYLAGKIINTKTDTSDLEKMYTFNEGEILKNTENTNFAVSAYYSFVCLFTIVLE
jgi:hypothetical protein